jgi:LCP family protein required for cell wall assembly
VAGVAAGYYLWLNAKVSAANDRVSDEVRQALAEDPETTAPLTASTIAGPGPTTIDNQAPESPDAMNILLVGSDRRSSTGKAYGLSDTIMLVHVDPGNNYMSTISFPRDLRVDLKGYGKQKLNAAYSYGGPALSIRTIQSLTGVDIDHYLEVDFTAFRDMTDKLGGVYLEVDRRYYYNGGAYEMIDLQPGYRLLRGADALDYVRFRHDGNMDFGRMERQQRFLNAIRQQAMSWDLGLKLPGLVSAFFGNVTTDLGTNDFLKLAWWGVRLDGSRMRQVTLRGTTQTINGGSYVIASKEKIAAAMETFLTVPAGGSAEATASPGSGTATTSAAVSPLTGAELDVLNATAPSGSASVAADFLRGQGATVVTVGNSVQKVGATQVWYPAGASVLAKKVAAAVRTTKIGESSAVARVTVVLGGDFSPPGGSTSAGSPLDAAVWRGVARRVSFAVQAPSHIPSQYTISKRPPNNATIYEIKAGGDNRPILVMLYKLKGADQYMNITETSWLDAPLASPGKEVTHDGTVFTVVFTADKVERVWWKSDGVLYWVSNTLSHMANEDELLAVAESMVVVSGQ